MDSRLPRPRIHLLTALRGALLCALGLGLLLTYASVRAQAGLPGVEEKLCLGMVQQPALWEL